MAARQIIDHEQAKECLNSAKKKKCLHHLKKDRYGNQVLHAQKTIYTI
jgi:hypothetical protein